MFQIELLDTPLSETGKAAWLGTGAIWGKVLRLVFFYSRYFAL